MPIEKPILTYNTLTMNAMPRDNEEFPAPEDEDECPICHELYKSITEKSFLPCAHYFHKDCIVQWLVAHDSCPICRSLLLAGTSPNDVTITADGYAVIELNPTLDAMQQEEPNHYFQHIEENLRQLFQEIQEFQQMIREIKQGLLQRQQNLSD